MATIAIISIPRSAPRNPLFAAARARRAGAVFRSRPAARGGSRADQRAWLDEMDADVEADRRDGEDEAAAEIASRIKAWR